MKPTAIAVALLTTLTLAACSGGEKDEHGMSETTAKANCKTMASDALGNNSDADWQNSYDVLAEQIPGGWWVQGEVAAPNAFGGKVPSTYSCRIVWDEAAQDHVINFDGIKPR